MAFCCTGGRQEKLRESVEVREMQYNSLPQQGRRPKTQLSSESAYSSLSSETQREPWSVAGQWLIGPFVLTTLSTQAVEHAVTLLLAQIAVHHQLFTATMDRLHLKTNEHEARDLI